jgi:hypothetical protein
MSNSLHVPVKESIKELRQMLKTSTPMLHPRLKMLICIKKMGDLGISKRALMEEVGACSQSIHNWRTAYISGGLEKLLSNGRKGNSGKPSVITPEEKILIEKKLKDPKNGLAGYIELQQWIEKEFKEEVK